MRIILSHGKVNIFNLAKNAGTIVEQIARFYAKHLPLSREMALNHTIRNKTEAAYRRGDLFDKRRELMLN